MKTLPPRTAAKGRELVASYREATDAYRRQMDREEIGGTFFAVCHFAEDAKAHRDVLAELTAEASAKTLEPWRAMIAWVIEASGWTPPAHVTDPHDHAPAVILDGVLWVVAIENWSDVANNRLIEVPLSAVPVGKGGAA